VLLLPTESVTIGEVRKLLTWIVVTVGLAALVRKLRGRREPEQPLPAADVDPADELRRTLAETREDEMPVPGVPPGPEPAIDEPEDEEAGDDLSIEERRAAVHEEGRAAMEEMRVPSDEPDR
jgi:hypothetical protein